MDYLSGTYVIYIVVTLLLTIWVGRALFTNGRVFLMEIFNQDVQLVDSINKLLLIGFYLINFGYVLWNLIISQPVRSLPESIEMLSVKIGLIIIVLGLMHFFNLFTLFRFRSKAKKMHLIPEKESVVEAPTT